MAESMNDLGTIYDIAYSGGSANGVSAYGSVIAGIVYFGSFSYDQHAFKYANGIMTDLGTLDGATSILDYKGRKTGPYSGAKGVSADGSVIVGDSFYAGGKTNVQAFKISDNSGSIYYLGAHSLAAPDMSETRHFVAANADYSLEKDQRVSLSAYYNKQSVNASHGTTATLNYMIGF